MLEFTNAFNGRPWAISKRVEGHEIDEIFDWAKDSNIDIMCQGIIELDSQDKEKKEWCSIWSFDNQEDKLMFALRFGFENLLDS